MLKLDYEVSLLLLHQEMQVHQCQGGFSFSNWAFAEREDRIEAKAIASFQKVGKTMWSHAEKAFDDHMNFVSHRLHQDMECAKSLSQCAAPEETMATLQDFYSRMASEYQDHFEKQAALFRDSFSESAAVVEELNETAMESVNEMSKAAEESLEETKAALKPAQARRKRSSVARREDLVRDLLRERREWLSKVRKIWMRQASHVPPPVVLLQDTDWPIGRFWAAHTHSSLAGKWPRASAAYPL